MSSESSNPLIDEPKMPPINQGALPTAILPVQGDSERRPFVQGATSPRVFQSNDDLKGMQTPLQTSMRERFVNLLATRSPYIALFDFEHWPDSFHGTPIFLAVQPHVLVSVLNLIPCGMNRYRVADMPSYECYVYPKGASVFPEKFESSMLATSEVRNDLRIPNEHYAFHALLYWQLAREGLCMDNLNRRRVMTNYISVSVGLFVAPDPVLVLGLANYAW